MDLLRAYGGGDGGKRVVAVAAEVDLGAGPSEGSGRFAGRGARGRGALELPQARREEAAETEGEQKKKRKVDEKEDEEEEEEEELDAVGKLPALPRVAQPAVASAARPVPVRATADNAAASPAAAPSAARPGAWGYVRYPELGAAEEEKEEEEGEEKGRRLPAMREVRQAELLRDQARIQAELAHEIAAPPASLSSSFGGRRKHQLGQMAQETAANMTLYEANKAQSSRTRKQVKAKYGW